MHLDFAYSQALAGFLRCHENAFEQLGGVPAEILYDRAKTVWLRDDDRQRPVFHPALLDFARYYGYEPKLCRAHRPQTKGKVEKRGRLRPQELLAAGGRLPPRRRP